MIDFQLLLQFIIDEFILIFEFIFQNKEFIISILFLTLIFSKLKYPYDIILWIACVLFIVRFDINLKLLNDSKLHENKTFIMEYKQLL